MINQESEQLTVAPDGRAPDEQPRWRQDFPIDWPQDEYVARREFIKFLLLTSVAFTVGQFWLLVQNFWRQQAAPQAQLITRVDEIPVGGSLIFHYPAESPARLLVRGVGGTFLPYDHQCTTLTCRLLPALEKGELHCPCHDGIFDLLTGRPLAGPPQRPLARVTLTVRDGQIFATGMERRTT